MKYLLLIALALLVVWLWRSARQAERKAQAPARPAPAARAKQEVTTIVACEVCHVHLPRSEALIGRGGQGVYCSEAHRREAEG